MSTEKITLILKLSKLFRIHSADANLFKSLFVASIIPLIQNDVNSISKILLELCQTDLLSSKTIQTSLDIAHELIKNYKNDKEDIESDINDDTQIISSIDTKTDNMNNNILAIDDITQIPVNILSNVFTFISIKELLTSTQFVSHQFIYAVRQPLVIHSMPFWLSTKIISYIATPHIDHGNYPLPPFYKLSQSVNHLSLQYNHTADDFTNLMLFKMHFIPTLSQLQSIHIHDSSLWNHQPAETNSITEILRYIEPKNKLNFKCIALNNVRIDYALIKYIALHFKLKRLKISTQARSVFKNLFFNVELNVNLLHHIEDIYCELAPSRAIIIRRNNEYQQYIDLFKLRLSKFLQFILHPKLQTLELNIKLRSHHDEPVPLMNAVFDKDSLQLQSLRQVNDLTLHLHQNIERYEWCSHIVTATDALECVCLVLDNCDELCNGNGSKRVFADLLGILWNKNKWSMKKISLKMKWNTQIINHGYCVLFSVYHEFWKDILNNDASLRFEIYIDCANTITITFWTQLIEFAKLIQQYDELSLVLQIGCFDEGTHAYLKAKQKEYSLFEKIDSLPSDYLGKTVIRAQMR